MNQNSKSKNTFHHSKEPNNPNNNRNTISYNHSINYNQKILPKTHTNNNINHPQPPNLPQGNYQINIFIINNGPNPNFQRYNTSELKNPNPKMNNIIYKGQNSHPIPPVPHPIQQFKPFPCLNNNVKQPVSTAPSTVNTIPKEKRIKKLKHKHKKRRRQKSIKNHLLHPPLFLHLALLVLLLHHHNKYLI